MRLIDRPIETLTGKPDQAPSADGRTEIASASTRYVLDIEASNACGELVRTGDGLFELDSPLLRLPAEVFWVELFEECTAAGPGPNRRMGYLVQAKPGGRAGSVQPFAETDDGLTRSLPCEIRFDLDQEIKPAPGMYRFQHSHNRCVAELLQHCRLVPDKTAMALLRVKAGSTGTVLTELAEGTWFALPLLFAFVALLNSPQVVETQPSDLDRLNVARKRRGRLPLLDHVEVRLALGEGSRAGSGGESLRAAPRLHLVRGHVVRRAGRTFWRQAHLRGDSQKAMATKIVRVTAGRSVQSGAARHLRNAVSSL